MKGLKHFFLRSLLLVCSLCLIHHSQAQQNTSAVASDNGFSAQVEISDITPLNNEIFLFTGRFTLPDGARNVKISANFSQELEVVSHSISSDYSGNITDFISVNSQPGTPSQVGFGFPNQISGNIAGTFQVLLRFPFRTACNNLEANISMTVSGLLSGVNYGVITNPIVTKCVVNNPWKIQKTIISPSVTYLGANASCGYGTTSTNGLVRYQVRIHRNSTTLNGSVLLDNLSLVDILPPGATITNLVEVAYENPFTNMTSNFSFSGGNLIFPSGFTLDPEQPILRIRFDVQLPSGWEDNCNINTVQLTGYDPCNYQHNASHQVGLTKIEVEDNAMVLTKSVNVDGNVPGCTGTYTINVRNPANATTPLIYNLTDAFPSCLTITGINSPAGTTVTDNNGTYTLTNAGTAGLNPNQLHTFTFTFVINSNCGTPIVNTVVNTGTFNASASATFHLLPEGAKPCITKQICNQENSYQAGDVIRFRLRVQNIGNQPIVGAQIMDNLNLDAFEYIGNELYYVNPNVNAACSNGGNIPATATAWMGVTTAHSGGSLKWNLPDIGVECVKFNNVSCGGAANTPAYFIEFDVRVIDATGIGTAKNTAQISGGNIVTPATHTISLVIDGNEDYTLRKTVSSNGVDFVPQVETGAGSTVTYDLNIINSGIGISKAHLVDLLPNDNGSSDNYILLPNSRSMSGSFDITFLNFLSSTQTFVDAKSSTATGINTTNELGVTVNTNPPAWTTGLNAGTSNFYVYLDQPVNSQTSSSFKFTAKVDDAGQYGMVSCNTFAIRPVMKRFHNGNTVYELLTALESITACVKINKEANPCCVVKDYSVPESACFGEAVEFCVFDDCEGEGMSYEWHFDDGTILTGPCVQHVFTTLGSQTVWLFWKDNCGKEFKKEFKIEIKDCPCKVEVKYTIETNGADVVGDASGTVISGGIPAAYVWNMGNGVLLMGPQIQYTYPQYGSYEVRLTVYVMNAKGEICTCVDKCARKIDVVPEVSKIYPCPEETHIISTPVPTFKMSNEAPSAITLKASPNPFHDQLNVSFEMLKTVTSKGHYRLEMIDANGVAIWKQQLNNLDKPVQVKTSQWAPGMYVLFLRDANGVIQAKQVVKMN